MINKIDGIRGVRRTETVKRTSKAGGSRGSGFSGHLDETGAASEAGPTTGAGAINSVGAVLGAQEVEDALARASRGKARAKDLLDLLDNLRLELLAGGLTKERLMQLARVISQRRPQISDPQLTAILDEIDLRAQVELAKYAP